MRGHVGIAAAEIEQRFELGREIAFRKGLRVESDCELILALPRGGKSGIQVFEDKTGRRRQRDLRLEILLADLDQRRKRFLADIALANGTVDMTGELAPNLQCAA